MANDGSIVIDSRIDNKQLKKDLDKLSANVKGAFGAIGKAAAAGLAVATVAVAGFAASSVKEFAVFESGMNEVFTLLPDITEDAMKSMEKDVLSFAKEMKTLPEDVVPALYQAISAGVPKDNVFDFLEIAQKAAKGGVTDLETAVDGISSVVNAYGDDVIDATSASDLMFTAVKNGKTSFEELSASLFQVIPTASGLGVEFGNITAALASMTAQGTPTSVATTQLRSLLTELSKEGTKTSDTFKELSGKTFKQFVADGGDLQDALQLMEEGAANLGVGVSDMFGSVEAGNAALALTGKGTESFTRNLKDMQSAAGATDTAYNTMDSGINTAIEGLKANFSALKIQVGDELAPIIESLTQKFSDFIGNEELVDEIINTVIETLGFLGEAAIFVWEIMTEGIEVIKEIIEFFQEHETLTQILIITIGTLTAIIIAYNIAMGIAAAVTTAFTAVMAVLTSPITLIIAAIAALIAITILIVKHWDEIKAFFAQLWIDIKESFNEAIEAIGLFFVNLWEDIKEGFSTGIQSIKDFFNGLWEFMTTVFDGVSDIGSNIVTGIWDGIKEKATWLKDKVKNFFDNVIGDAKDFLGIHSPSVVFKEQVGENMAAGVGVGFDDQFKNVNKTITGRLSGLTDSVSANVSSGMRSGQVVNNNQSSTENNFAGMFEGANFEVRSSADIKNIATETSRAIQNAKVNRSRGLGYAR